jgi:hypothetical protein
MPVNGASGQRPDILVQYNDSSDANDRETYLVYTPIRGSIQGKMPLEIPYLTRMAQSCSASSRKSRSLHFMAIYTCALYRYLKLPFNTPAVALIIMIVIFLFSL